MDRESNISGKAGTRKIVARGVPAWLAGKAAVRLALFVVVAIFLGAVTNVRATTSITSSRLVFAIV